MEKEYSLEAPRFWVKQNSDEEIVSRIKETAFSKEQIENHRDFCYYLDKVLYTTNAENSEYTLMAYSLNQADTLKNASVREQVVEEGEQYLIHRIAVLRDGQLIDKTPDIAIKVMDDERESSGGVFNSFKKVNITIKDLRLYDILIWEDSSIITFPEKELVRKKFYRSIWSTPDVYWSYGELNFKFINERDEPVSYKKVLFRDSNHNLLPEESGLINKGETLEFSYRDYINNVDNQREINPFIDFATKADWPELSSFIAPYYEETLAEHKLAEFAPELIDKLAAIGDRDLQIAAAIEYVQNQVHYIYNEAEMHGHLPQSPALTFKYKQGDCKAKCVLLKSILDYLQVPSEIVLVNFRTDDFIDLYYQPSPLVFNHVVLKIQHNGEEYFVDPTIIDDYGTLENRIFVSFKCYLPIESNSTLQYRPSMCYKHFCVDEVVNINAKNGRGTVNIRSKFRNGMANNRRNYYRNASRQEILDNWNNFLFSAMNYATDRRDMDFRNIFKNAQFQIISDDKSANELITEYSVEVDDIYFKEKDGSRYLMYFDYSIAKDIRDYKCRDLPYWHQFFSEKYEINLNTDENIDTNEKYTIQETEINGKYLTFSIKKDIRRQGGSAFIRYEPLNNVGLNPQEWEELREQYAEINNSNQGLGIDIVEKGFFGKLMDKLFRK